jgi:hypothetical protein
MLPFFYFNPQNKSFCLEKKEGVYQVTNNDKVYGFLSSNNEFFEFEDQNWVVTQFKNMVFLDQCYWV